MSRNALSLNRHGEQTATRFFRGRGRRVSFLLALQTLVMSGFRVSLGSVLFAQGSYLFAQATAGSNTVPDALGTTVLTVGGGGLALALAAISKDFWAYKKQLIESEERRQKEERDSKERLEKARLEIERMRVSQAKNNRLTNAMFAWMTEAYRTQKFPAPPPRVHLPDDPKGEQ